MKKQCLLLAFSSSEKKWKTLPNATSYLKSSANGNPYPTLRGTKPVTPWMLVRAAVLTENTTLRGTGTPDGEKVFLR